MNSPKNHHFVPEGYLKEFSNSEKKLFQLKKGFKKISSKSVAQVCYEPYYFKVNSKDSLLLHQLNDQYHIEKNVFKKQENEYSKLLKKVTYPSLSFVPLNKTDTFFFLEILLTIKRRNPVYRQRIINHYKEYVVSDQFKKDVELGIEISRRIDKIDPEEYLKNYIEEVKLNTDKQSDMYLQVFLDKENKSTKNAAQILLQYKLFIFHAPFGSEFITSDNPGFTLLSDNQLLSFGGFGLQFKFIFPLTQRCCLFINHGDIENDPLLLTKNIYTVNVDKNVVDTINSCTHQIAMERVFSYSKNTLLNLRDKNFEARTNGQQVHF